MMGAIAKVLGAGKGLTPDLGGQGTTSQLAAAVKNAL
jgi:isocitrate/isopropylmalate dehydrogenase